MAIVRIDPFDFQAPFPLDIRMAVPGLNDRNDIPENALWQGMNVWVASEGVEYKLVDKAARAWVQVYPVSAPAVPMQVVTVSATAPTNSAGSVGDIWFRPLVTIVEVYQKTAPTTWTLKGSISIGSTESTADESLSYDETSASLNVKYPGAAVGRIYYSETNGVVYTKKSETLWVLQAII